MSGISKPSLIVIKFIMIVYKRQRTIMLMEVLAQNCMLIFLMIIVPLLLKVAINSENM